MPLYDEDFGAKLIELEKAIGFRFPPTDFQNVFIAKLLHTTPETMSRKKSGKRRVTESDWSAITDYFDLARYGFEAGMFAEDLDLFAQKMRDIAKRALIDAKPDRARQDLFDIAIGSCGGKLVIELVDRNYRGGGIGADPAESNAIVLRDGDKVVVKTTVPGDGSLYLLNDERGKDITCLMPSSFAPNAAVKKGEVTIPKGGDQKHFPVGGPANRYRLYAVWFDHEPELAMLAHPLGFNKPRALEHAEFMEVVAHAKTRSESGTGIMVAIADYEVR